MALAPFYHHKTCQLSCMLHMSLNSLSYFLFLSVQVGERVGIILQTFCSLIAGSVEWSLCSVLLIF